MKTTSCVLLVLLTLLTGAFGCARPAPTAPQADMDKIVAGNSAFALDLYVRVREGEGNLFFSPYSISTALAMTYAGARGDTAEQMGKVLRFSLAQEAVPAAVAAVDWALTGGGKPSGYKLTNVNALWGQKGHPFLPAFLNLTGDVYGASLREVDFETAAEPARRVINAWVAEQTNQKIKELLGPDELDAMTRLVLTNAIYFKGDWAHPFKKAQTRDEKFHVTSTQDVVVPLMHRKGDFRYLATEDFQALEMPYVGKTIALVALLPRKADGLSAVEKMLTTERLAGWLGNLHETEVEVFFPRFQLTQKLALRETLSALGMPLAFRRDEADFSGIDGSRLLYVSSVAHQAFVDVNEEGTEAAAATGTTFRAVSGGIGGPPVFRADHPFIFFIRDTRSGSILFMGRLVQPKP